MMDGKKPEDLTTGDHILIFLISFKYILQFNKLYIWYRIYHVVVFGFSLN